MGLLNDLGRWPSITLVDLVNDGERATKDVFDSVELGMNNGRTVAVIVVSSSKGICNEVNAFRRMVEGGS